MWSSMSRTRRPATDNWPAKGILMEPSELMTCSGRVVSLEVPMLPPLKSAPAEPKRVAGGASITETSTLSPAPRAAALAVGAGSFSEKSGTLCRALIWRTVSGVRLMMRMLSAESVFWFLWIAPAEGPLFGRKLPQPPRKKGRASKKRRRAELSPGEGSEEKDIGMRDGREHKVRQTRGD